MLPRGQVYADPAHVYGTLTLPATRLWVFFLCTYAWRRVSVLVHHRLGLLPAPCMVRSWGFLCRALRAFGHLSAARPCVLGRRVGLECWALAVRARLPSLVRHGHCLFFARGTAAAVLLHRRPRVGRRAACTGPLGDPLSAQACAAACVCVRLCACRGGLYCPHFQVMQTLNTALHFDFPCHLPVLFCALQREWVPAEF